MNPDKNPMETMIFEVGESEKMMSVALFDLASKVRTFRQNQSALLAPDLLKAILVSDQVLEQIQMEGAK